MKNYLFILMVIILSGCSHSSTDSSYCRAISSNVPTRELVVRDVYIYGTLDHGTILISPSCLHPVFRFYSFQDSISPKDGASYRIRRFNESVYNSPSRASGMFEINGVFNIYPETELVELYDINGFREVDEREAQSIINLLRQGRK
jgi:hypothetical protein